MKCCDNNNKDEVNSLKNNKDDSSAPGWRPMNEARNIVDQPTIWMLSILKTPADDTITTVISDFKAISKYMGQKYTINTWWPPYLFQLLKKRSVSTCWILGSMIYDT